MSVSPFMTVREVAQILDLTPTRIRQLVAANEIPHVRYGKSMRSIRIPRAAFDAWMDELNQRALRSVGL